MKKNFGLPAKAMICFGPSTKADNQKKKTFWPSRQS